MAGLRLSLSNGANSRGLVLDLIRTHGPISRTDLAEATGLTQATMSTLVRQLIGEGLVHETGRRESKGGRPLVLLDINPVSRFAVGVQVGAESITYVTIDLGGAIVGRVRTEGVGSSEPPKMVARLAKQIDSMLAHLGVDAQRVVGIGMAAPGPLDLTAGAILGPPHLEQWKNVPIRSLLADATALPVIVDNDATAAAIGDFWSGVLGTVHAHATIYMGLGIGAGVVINGTVFRGASSNAGEIGQVPIATAADGSPLTIEELADPWAVVSAARRSPADAARLKLAGTDTFTAFRMITRAALHGDAFATEVLEKSAEHLATGATVLANLFDLDSITLAGPAFALAGSLYVRIVEQRVNAKFFARAKHEVRVRLSTHVSDAAAVGAAALALQSELAPRTMGLTALEE
jgi:predicted NBD/HSP70 family sugar kinase